MTIELDHTIVSARDKVASARQLAELLGVPWAPTTLGPFSAVYVNEGLTLDFIETGEDFPVQHFCFRVSPQEFDAILGRIQAAGIPYRSEVRGPWTGRSTRSSAARAFTGTSPRATSGKC
jgi:catechol 2,3-dioxygenase-like lactoylglutathione lyase family enzyme